MFVLHYAKAQDWMTRVTPERVTVASKRRRRKKPRDDNMKETISRTIMMMFYSVQFRVSFPFFFFWKYLRSHPPRSVRLFVLLCPENVVSRDQIRTCVCVSFFLNYSAIEEEETKKTNQSIERQREPLHAIVNHIQTNRIGFFNSKNQCQCRAFLCSFVCLFVFLALFKMTKKRRQFLILLIILFPPPRPAP